MSAKNERPSLGFSGELDTLDLAEFAISKPKASKPEPETARKAAEAAGFQSREPAPKLPKVQQRRRRTGRTAQLNLKLKPETIEAFTRIADANGWGLGEAFERATALLEQQNVTR